MATENLTEIGLVFTEEGYDSLLDKVKKVGQEVEKLTREDAARVEASAKVAKATAELSNQIDRATLSYAGSKSEIFAYKAAQLGNNAAIEEQIRLLQELEEYAKQGAEATKIRLQAERNASGLANDRLKDELTYQRQIQDSKANAAKMERGLEADRIRDIQNNVAYERKMRDGLAADKLKDELVFQKYVQDTKAQKIKADAEAIASARRANAEAIALAEKQAISEINWAKKSRDEQIRIKREVATYRAAGISNTTIAGTFGSAALTGTVRPVDIPVNRERFERDIGSMRNSVIQLRSVLATLGISLGVTGLIRLSDTYTQVTGKILNATTSQSQYNFVLQDSMRIASNAQANVGSIAQSYARLINNTQELGVSQKSLSLVVEASALSLKVIGASVQETTSALQQLSQAFGKGKLDGDEFRTLMEASPGLMRQVAESMRVPFGALKDLAKQGIITGDVLVKALGDPKYVEALRVQAKEMLTISGAFEVLTNKLVMFVGESSKSNGVVRAFTVGLTGLADNLGIVAGLVTTLVAARLAQWLASQTTELYRQAAARQANLAATLANARADAVATGAAVTLTTARVAELRAAAAAASGNVALAITVNGLVPAQARAAAAAAAHTAALGALSVAARAASVSMALARGAVGLLGGPIGAIITVLGLAAVAWANWGDASKKANEKAAESTEATTGEMIQNLEKQNAKLRERNALARAGNIAVASQPSAEAERLASIYAKMEALKAKGTGATTKDKLDYIDLQSNYDRLNKELTSKALEQKEADQIGQLSKAEALMLKLANNTEKMNAELKKYKTELGEAFTPEMEKRIRDKYKERTPRVKVVQEDSFVGLNKYIQDQDREFQAEAKHTDRMMAHREKQFQSATKLAQDSYAVAKDNADTKSAIGIAEISVYSDYVNKVKELNVQLAKDQLAKLDREVEIGQETTDAIVKQAEAQITKTEDGLTRKLAIIEKARDKQRELEGARNDKVYEIGEKSYNNISEANSQVYKQSIADANKLIDATDKLLAQREKEFAQIGMSKIQIRELEELEDRRTVAKYAAALQEAKIASQTVGLNETEIAMYKERIAKLDELYGKTQRLVELNEKQKVLQGDWQAGMAKGLGNYLETVDNTYDSARKLTEQTFKNMEDALSGFVATGKLNFKSLFTTLGAGLARLYIQSKVLGPIADILNGKGSGGSGGTFGSGGGGIMQSIIKGAGSLFGFGSGGGSSLNTMAPVMPLLGGVGYASGGSPDINTPYLVGENGPEWHVDRRPSTILPNGQSPAGSGQTINISNTFLLSQPADQRTQDQIVVKVGQSIQRATARNT